jgi:adenylate cyclase
MAQQRLLAAIMFTDIVGYTTLMGKDEQHAFALLHDNRELQKPVIESFNGRWVKEMGDGVLSTFNSVSDAVLAAIEIQERCALNNSFQLRIGIHHGEVVVEENDVFGDAVNIAARLQALAPVGGIWISESVHQNVSNKKKIRSRYIKEVRLKNVKDPVRVYEVLTGVIQAPQKKGVTLPFKRFINRVGGNRFWMVMLLLVILLISLSLFYFSRQGSIRFSKGDTQVDRSIAVLPFVNLSNDKEQEYFSDGLSEDLLNRLAKIPGLKVIARTSSFAFKGKNEDIRAISQTLGVAHILEGSVQREGNRVRVTAQLIRAADGAHLWSEQYDRQLEGLLKLQDEISQAVVQELKLKFLLPGSVSGNPEAYNFLLQGNYFFDKLDEENVARALGFYRKALALDSSNALPWAMLAKVYSRQAWQNYINQQQGYEQARVAAVKSISLDPRLASGHTVLGGIKMYYDFDWKGAGSEFQEALRSEPSNPDVINNIGVLYQILGQWDLAIEKLQQAISLDPLRPIYYNNQGANLTYAGRIDEANEQYKKLLEINPQFQRAHMYLGRNLLIQGKKTEAFNEMKKEMAPVFSSFGMLLAYHALDNKKEAGERLSRFISENRDRWPFLIAEAYAFMGNKDEAFQWLETAYNKRDSWLIWIKGDPLLKNLEGDPRLTAFLKKMNFSG